MVVFGLVLLVRAGESPPFADLPWDDLPHAIRVILVATAATALYTVLGFLVTIALLLFTLVFVVERQDIVRAAAFSVGVTVFAYLFFAVVLKTPLPRGLLGL
jgi:hypothetical protein